MKPQEHPHMTKLWNKYHEPITVIYSLAVLTYVAVGLTLGWFQ